MKIMTLEIKDARYIVMMLDTKGQEHDGEIFCDLKSAKEYALDALKDNYCDKIVIGYFVLEANREQMPISFVETIGFRNDKSRVEQLRLFK